MMRWNSVQRRRLIHMERKTAVRNEIISVTWLFNESHYVSSVSLSAAAFPPAAFMGSFKVKCTHLWIWNRDLCIIFSLMSNETGIVSLFANRSGSIETQTLKWGNNKWDYKCPFTAAKNDLTVFYTHTHTHMHTDTHHFNPLKKMKSAMTSSSRRSVSIHISDADRAERKQRKHPAFHPDHHIRSRSL